MKKFLIWITVIFFIMLFFLFIAYSLLNIIFDNEPVVYSHSYLDISISGDLPHYVPPDAFQELIRGTPLDLLKIRQSLTMAAVDNRIHAVILSIDNLSAGYAKLQEIHSYIDEFRKSGKKIYAFLNFASMKDYYLATACDSIILIPGGNILLPGVRAEIIFMKGLLDFVGIEADFEQIGKYKNAPDIYKRKSISEPHKEVLENIVNSNFDEFVQKISEKRKIPKQKIDELINSETIFTAENALKARLIDDILYYEDIQKKLSNKKIHKISSIEYSRVVPSTLGIQKDSKIAVIFASGTLLNGEDYTDPVFGKVLGADRITDIINFAGDNNSFKAIIMHINSPGGSAISSEKIWYAIKNAAIKKPTIAVISEYGASGGYMIALEANKILAQKNSLIGSIGVFAGKFTFNKLLDKLNINTENIYRGKNANIFSTKSKFSRTERLKIRKLIKSTYSDFINKVADGRDMKISQVEKYAQGRVWTGKESFQIGLIDTIGGFSESIKIAKHIAGIPEDEDPKLIFYPRKKSLYKQIFSNIMVFRKSIKETLLDEVKVIKKINLKPMTLMPYLLIIH